MNDEARRGPGHRAGISAPGGEAVPFVPELNATNRKVRLIGPGFFIDKYYLLVVTKIFIIRDLGLKRRSYFGSNVFGVTVKVKEASEVQYTIKPISLGSSINSIKLKINKLSDEFNKENIGALFICKAIRWNNCYMTMSGGGKSPTISSPSAYYHVVYNINVELYEVWIYNQKTGEIYLKQKMV